VLLRQLYLLFFPFLCLWVWWAAGGFRLRAIKALALSSLVIIMMILPFTFYNYARFTRFVLLNTNAGYALYWANHPIYGTSFIPILPGDLYLKILPAELKELKPDEATLDQELFSRGVQFIVDDPVRYALLSLSRIPAFFEFWPTSDTGAISNITRVASFGILWPFMLYGLIRSFVESHRRKETFGSTLSSPVMLLYLFIFFYTILHLLIWALIRYRLPVDTVLLIFAGLGLADLANRLFGKRWAWAKPAPVV
jgi:hypothetical protein